MALLTTVQKQTRDFLCSRYPRSSTVCMAPFFHLFPFCSSVFGWSDGVMRRRDGTVETEWSRFLLRILTLPWGFLWAWSVFFFVNIGFHSIPIDKVELIGSDQIMGVWWLPSEYNIWFSDYLTFSKHSSHVPGGSCACNILHCLD